MELMAARLARGGVASRPHGQRGATLVVGLVLLLVLTLLGISGMSMAKLEVTMAGNAQFQQDAFQLAEDGIDLILAQRAYSTDGERTIPWLGTPNSDRRAVATFVRTAPIVDRAFSVGAVQAFHFDVVSVGVGPRNATATHIQSFYVPAQAR